MLTLQVDDGDGRLNYKEFEKMVQIAQKSKKNSEEKTGKKEEQEK